MKDSQLVAGAFVDSAKYIKANNERFSTNAARYRLRVISISRRIMKDSQRAGELDNLSSKYIKANNERFSTVRANNSTPI